MFTGSTQGSTGGGNFDYSQMQQMFAAMMGMMNAEKDKDKGEREKGTRGRAILDEEHFRRMDVLERDRSRYRHCLFGLNVAIGTIDKDLAKEVDRLVKTENILGDKCDYESDVGFKKELWDKYSGNCIECWYA